MQDKNIIQQMLIALFEGAELDEGRPIPHSIESIQECLEDKKDILHKFESPYLTKEEEIDLMYELFQHTILIEVQKITWDLDKKGLLESGVNEKGEISYSLTKKGLGLLP